MTVCMKLNYGSMHATAGGSDMRGYRAFLLMLMLCRPVQAGELVALVYHDIVDRPGRDEFALTTDEFASHLAYLKSEGYRPVSLSDLQAARDGGRTLPAKAVLITFDDGLRSYREQALPLLKRHGYPSVVTVVSRWADGQAIPPAYAGKVMGWNELRSLRQEPLVEIASHSHDLHRELKANPQADKSPAGVVRQYDDVHRRYETNQQFLRRIDDDLKSAIGRFRDELKLKPRALAWPYGEYDGTGLETAGALGFEYQFTLDDEPNSLASLPRVHRVMLRRRHGVAALEEVLAGKDWRTRPIRFLRVHLGDITGDRPEPTKAWLPALVRQVQLLRVNSVVINPMSSSNRAALFEVNGKPVVADVLSHAVHALRKAEVRHVYLDLSSSEVTFTPEVLADILSRNRVQGVILGESADSHHLATLRRRHPPLRLGTAGRGGDLPADFRLMTGMLSDGLDRVRELATGNAGSTPRTLLSLEGRAATDTQILVRYFQEIRATGLKDFGLGYSVAPQPGIDSIPVAMELAGHVVSRP